MTGIELRARRSSRTGQNIGGGYGWRVTRSVEKLGVSTRGSRSVHGRRLQHLQFGSAEEARRDVTDKNMLL